jgi:predicted Zn-dependent peptidase
MEHRLFEKKGYTLQCIRTDKFKTFSIALRFAGAFLPETLNVRALLPEVLLGGTKSCPSKEALQTRMDELYGLSVNTTTEKMGRMSIISFEMKSVNGKFLPHGSSTIAGALDLLGELIYEPKLIQGIFRKKTVSEEIRLLKEDFEAEYVDKTEYAYNQFMNAMFHGELHQYRAKGNFDSLGSVTAEQITNCYHSMLSNDCVTILVVGDFDPDEIDRLVAQRFGFQSPQTEEVWLDRETKQIQQLTTIREIGDITQSRINLGYRLDLLFGDPDYYAGALLNAILGEFEHSKLFQIVREKHTLCYYVHSMYDSSKGFISIMAGTDPDNETKAIDLIKEVVCSIQRGEITDEEVTLAKASLSKRVRQNADSPERLANLDYLYRKILSRDYDADRSLATIQTIQKSDIVASANRLIADTLYLLSKKEQ